MKPKLLSLLLLILVAGCLQAQSPQFPGLPIFIEATVASGSTIAVNGSVLLVTGTSAIGTITPPTGCTTATGDCYLILVADTSTGPFTLNTSGNIAEAQSPQVGSLTLLVYRPASSKWYSNTVPLTAATQTTCDNSTKIATTAYFSGTCATVQTGTTYSPSAQSETIFNNSGSTLAVTLPTPFLGLVKCLQEYHTATGVLSFIPPSGVTIYYKGIAGTSGSATGLVSGGVAGDQLCLEGTTSTTYEAVGPGATSTAWVNH